MILLFPPSPLLAMTEQGLIEIHDHSEEAQRVELDIRCRWKHGRTLNEIISDLCGVMGRVIA